MLFISLFIYASIESVSALSVTATIPVGSPNIAAYDSGNSRIYITNSSGNNVAVISDTTNTVIDSVSVGKYPYGIAYDSGKGELFVANLYDNTVSVISDSTDSVVATITVGASPYMCAYDSAKGEIFVTNQHDGTVSVISDSTNTVVKTVTVGTEPFDAVYDSGKGEVFVSNMDANTISVISDSTNEVVQTISVPSCQFLAYDSAKGEIFVGNYDSHSISVISDDTNTVVATVSNIDESQIEGLAYDSGRGEVFVALHQSNKVIAISDSTNQVVTDITVGDLPWGIAYDSGRSALYVTNGGSNDVSVISDAGTSASSNPTSNATHTTSDSGGFSWLIIVIIVIVVLILLLIIILWLRSRRDLKITVKDSRTQSPIQGAQVATEGQSKLSDTTGNSGQVVFKGVEKGDYTIQAAAAGYNPSAPLLVSVKGSKTEVVIKLDPTGPKPPTVSTPIEPPQTLTTVTASTKPQSISLVEMQTPASVSSQPAEQETSELQGWRGDKVREVIETFKMKGAISPETALTASELGLSRLFVRVMEKRKGQTRFIVEVDGKYYLDQKALEER